MAKTGRTSYFNPEIPFTTPGRLVNPEFWRLWLEQLNTEAFALIDLATDVTGVLPIANGGTNASTANLAFSNLSPMTTRGDLISRNATVPIRVPIGTIGQIVTTTNGLDVSWASPSSVIGGRFAPILLLMGS